jgi:protein CpxP
VICRVREHLARTGWRTVRVAIAIVGAMCAVPAIASAQDTPPAPVAGQPEPGHQAGQGGPGDARRQMLVQAIRQRFEQVVRQRLQLNDTQIVKLRETNARFEGERRALTERERWVRQQMRAQLVPGVAADQNRLATLIDSLFALQRERLDLLQREQRELSGYLTPLQRVQYYALQEQLRRRLEQMRQRMQQRAAAQGGLAAPPPF